MSKSFPYFDCHFCRNAFDLRVELRERVLAHLADALGVGRDEVLDEVIELVARDGVFGDVAEQVVNVAGEVGRHLLGAFLDGRTRLPRAVGRVIDGRCDNIARPVRRAVQRVAGFVEAPVDAVAQRRRGGRVAPGVVVVTSDEPRGANRGCEVARAQNVPHHVLL